MSNGKNAVLWAHKQHAPKEKHNALGEYLIEAVRSGQEVRVRDALVKGADINYMCQSPTHPPIWHIGAMTALMLAAHRGDAVLVQLLVDKKADKHAVNHLGKKAVDYAKTDQIKAILG